MTDLGSAIKQVFDSYKNEEPSPLDMGLFAQACSKELKSLDIAYFSMYLETDMELVIEMPLFKSVKIEFDSLDKGGFCVLNINGTNVRKIRLQDTSARYGNQLAIAMLDYFKRFLIYRQRK